MKAKTKNTMVGGYTDSRGEWRPEKPLSFAPVFVWPPKAKQFLIWLLNYLFTWNLIYLGIVLLSYYFLQPPLEEMKTFKLSWISTIFARNMALVWLVYGGWHLYLYKFKSGVQKPNIVPDGKVPRVPHFYGTTRYTTMCFGHVQVLYLYGQHTKL